MVEERRLRDELKMVNEIDEQVGVLLPELYEAEGAHWWSAGMRAITHALLEDVTLPGGPILEIGCGGGAFLEEMGTRHPGHLAIGTDLNPVALAHARRGGRQAVALSDLHHLPFADERCGTIVGLDSFDQWGVDLEAAVAETARVLQPGGLLLVRVSAYDWLRGPHDVAFGTGRRYSASEMRAALEAVRLRPLRVTYANSLLFLPAAAVRLAQQGGHGSVESQLETPSVLSGLFNRLLRGEARWLRRQSLPFGLSLYALAQK